MSSTGIFTQTVMTCPACKTEISGRFSHEMSVDKPMITYRGQIQATVKITGMSVEHNCIPKVTR